MIPVIVFFGHTIFACWAFCKSYQSDGWVQAILNVCFIVILFTVGWTISDLLVGFVISDAGYLFNLPSSPLSLFFLKITGVIKMQGSAELFTGSLKSSAQPKDSISLLVLTVIEFYFYRFYFKQAPVSAKPAFKKVLRKDDELI